jgi:hypothetical protein
MVKQDALTQAGYETKFLEQQPEGCQLLWRQFGIVISIDTDRMVFKIDCGDPGVVALVEPIKGSLNVPSRWRLDIYC